MEQKFSVQWARVRARLRAEIGEAAFQSWLKPLVCTDLIDGVVHLTAPTRFIQNWVDSQYRDRIFDLWRGEYPRLMGVLIDHAAPSVQPSSYGYNNSGLETGQTTRSAGIGFARGDGVATVSADAASGAHKGGAEEDASVDVLSTRLEGRYQFENFITGKPNELAFAAARRVAEADNVPFNPLFLFGGVGLGKTHLMHAMARYISEHRPDKKVLYVSAETFMNQFIRAVRYKDTVAFKDAFRSVDVLMVDDVQFISGKESTQEEFFHTFNALVDQNRQVVISADKSPAELEGIEERMKSRLGWGLVAEIHATTYELRLGILQSKAEKAGAEIPDKVLEFLAHKITSNVRELEGALNRLMAYSNLIGRAITLENTQEALHDILRANDRRVTIEEIQKRVAEHYHMRLSEMHSARRSRAIARPRQVAMYLSKHLTTRSLPEIGRKFGGRDHTTVMHAVRKIDELKQSDSSFAEDVELLRRMLEG